MENTNGKNFTTWSRFDKNNIPPDGSYIGRTHVPDSVNNPGYKKLTIINGYCSDIDLEIVTHYMKDPGV